MLPDFDNGSYPDEIPMKNLVVAIIALCLAPAVGAQDRSSEHARKTLDIYRTIIAIDTSKKGATVRVEAPVSAAALKLARRR